MYYKIPKLGRLGYKKYDRPNEWAGKKGYGIEIELFCEEENLTEYAGRLNEFGIITEVDGSLCRERGMECIGGPFTLIEYQRGESCWEPIWTENLFENCKGATMPLTNTAHYYGMHISISREFFKNSMHIAKFCIALNQFEALGKKVANRSALYLGGGRRGEGYKQYKAIEEIEISDPLGRKILQTNRFSPAYIKKNIVEVRIFRSTLSKSHTLKNIEYCAALKNFVEKKELAVFADEEAGTREFLKWLKNQKAKKLGPLYPNLRNFLATNKVKGYEAECQALSAATSFEKNK